MEFLMLLRNFFNKKNITFTVFIGLIFLFFPAESTIEKMELRPHYPLKQFYIEIWRLLSGHFVHANWSHFFINLLNIILLRLVFREWLSTKIFITFIIFTGIFISIGLWAITNLTSYVGFSGIFHGLLLYLLLLHWQSARIIFSIAIFCIIMKIIYEQFYGASSYLIELIGIGIATESHALGAISGIIFYFIEYFLTRNAIKYR